jgi:hypothetical protein
MLMQMIMVVMKFVGRSLEQVYTLSCTYIQLSTFSSNTKEYELPCEELCFAYYFNHCTEFEFALNTLMLIWYSTL